jgi:hypothetical protein
MAKQFVTNEAQRKREGIALRKEWDNYMERTGKTQSEIIADLSINPGLPSVWFRGLKQIPAKQLLKMALHMGFRPEAIRPQLQEDAELWLKTYKAEVAPAIFKRLQELDAEGIRYVTEAIELAEIRLRSKQQPPN